METLLDLVTGCLSERRVAFGVRAPLSKGLHTDDANELSLLIAERRGETRVECSGAGDIEFAFDRAGLRFMIGED